MNFLPGDMIFSSKGVYRHLGIYLGDGKVIDCSAMEGRSACRTLEAFAAGGIVGLQERPDQREVETVIARAWSRLGERYSLTNNNCEHFAYWALDGIRRSPQLAIAVISACAIGAYFLTRRK